MNPSTRGILHESLVYMEKEGPQEQLDHKLGWELSLDVLMAGQNLGCMLIDNLHQATAKECSAKSSPAVLQQSHLCQIILRSCWLTETQIPPE